MANGSTTDTFLLEFEKPIGQLDRQIRELETLQASKGVDYSGEIRKLRTSMVSLIKKTYSNLNAWETVMVARHKNRPLLPDYLEMIVRDWRELHGDRNFRDDSAIMTGLGRIGTEKVMIVGHNKGRDTKEKMANFFGCAHPEGYRKALLKMKMAAKFHLPVVTFIDTPGAYPGIGAEERGQAQAIALNLLEMSRLATPVVCVVIGEGGSGGALGIGVGDKIGIMEYAYYSVISPEGCAAILWRSGEFTSQAADALRLTSRALHKLKVVDEVIPEPLGGAHRNRSEAAASVERFIVSSIRQLKRLKPDELLERRYRRWREVGYTIDKSAAAAAPAAQAPADPAPARKRPARKAASSADASPEPTRARPSRKSSAKSR
ncbi:MAG: Acetyl-coenzyme A carboxylase carboxyl transferase subunit alpha [Phycisphaerae bacterium]|nr:Acetyl-coenzyme A carboxylase carboxyl transferase subunit alpha [Phycisphaerae bacterium]